MSHFSIVAATTGHSSVTLGQLTGGGHTSTATSQEIIFQKQETKMAEGSFHLAWNSAEREATVLGSLAALQESGECSDVSLISSDDGTLRAHRVVLAACSPFFREVFSKNSVANLSLYMSGLKQVDLEAILDFMYRGQTEVPMADLEAFIWAAKEMRVLGLTNMDVGPGAELGTGRSGKISSNQGGQGITKYSCSRGKCTSNFKKETSLLKHMKRAHEKKKKKTEGLSHTTYNDKGHLSENILNQNTGSLDSENILDDETGNVSITTNYQYNCNNCVFGHDKLIELTNHQRVIHGMYRQQKGKYKCSHCDYNFMKRTNLIKHQQDIHDIFPLEAPTKVVEFPCNKCDYKALETLDLKNHLYTHNIGLSCKQCDFKTSGNNRGEMKKELSSHRSHEHMRKCSKCEYIAKGKADFTKHFVQAHKMSTVFPCLECDYKARAQENLDRHVKFIVHRPNSEINSVD